MAWSAQSLQFALFVAPKPGQPDALQPWLKLFQTGPQNYQQAPAGAPQLQSSATAPIGNLNVTVGAMPGRYDIVLTGIEAQPVPDTQPMIDDVQVALGVLVQYAKKFLEFQPSLRLAIIGNMIEQVSTQADANARFASLTSGINFPVGATDLALQLNVQKKEPITGHILNRLCRWQTQLLQTFTVQFDAATGVANPVMKSAHAVGCMIDANSVPSPIAFDRSASFVILDALAAEMEAIISGGYDYVVQ